MPTALPRRKGGGRLPAQRPIPQALRARALRLDDPFIIEPEGRITFGEACHQSAALAGRLLAAGIGKGSRIGVLHPNGARWEVAWLAAARIGALSVPLSTFAPGAELASALRHADVQAVLMGGRFAGNSLPDRLERGLPGLAQSASDLALADAPYLRWIHVDEDNRPWSRPLPRPLPLAFVHAAEREVAAADALAIINTSGATRRHRSGSAHRPGPG